MDLGIHNLWFFILAGWALNLTPGPDVFYMVTHALKSGWRAGAVAAGGITAGCFAHVAAATVGLSALVSASATAFSVLKWVGAAYLVYVGWQMLTSKTSPDAMNAIAARAIDQRARANIDWRIQAQSASLSSLIGFIFKPKNTSCGVFQPRHFRGLWFNA
jgi:threonine/homoserine/homoserine lactone efflux protein